jgi:hypothetical protein
MPSQPLAAGAPLPQSLPARNRPAQLPPAPGLPQDTGLPPLSGLQQGGLQQGGGLPQGAGFPPDARFQDAGLAQGTGLPQRGGAPQGGGFTGDAGLPQRRVHQGAGTGPRDAGGLIPPASMAPDPGSAASREDGRSWFATQNPSAPPREREPGIDRDYRLDRDRSIANETGPEEYSQPQASMPEPMASQSMEFGDDPLSGPLEAPDFQGTRDLPRRGTHERPAQAEFQPGLEADAPAAFRAEAPSVRPRRFEPGQQFDVPQPVESSPGFEVPQPFESTPGFDAPQQWDDPAPTQFDQPQIPDTPEYGNGNGNGAYPVPDQISPVYQTGMQLVVPPGGEWTFRDPGTGAIPRFGPQAGDYGQPGRPEFGGQGGSAPFAPGGLPAGPLAPPAERKRGRKAPILIGVAAVVVLIGVGAAVEGPKYLHHSDPGCTSYSSTALPAYNRAIGDLNSQASQATLTGDLSTAVSQLTAAVNQAHSASVKTALQGLLTDLTQVQADVRKGSVPASTVSTLNAASATADNACQGS